MCSADLKEFIEKNHLDLSQDGNFSARDAFGSHDDSDHVYNTARAWYMLRTLNPRTKVWDGPNAEYTPFSDDLPWCMVPEKKITVEDVKYVLSSHYQGTPYDPYGAYGDPGLRGMYRSIGINRNDFVGLVHIRPEHGEDANVLEWVAYGSNAFNAMVPFYAQVDDRGDVVFHLDMRETVTGLYATRDGYALVGWDKAEQRTRMAFYDMQGQKIREAEADALPAGFHVTSLYPQADGTMWAVDDSLTAAEVQKLLRLDENGRVMEEYAMNENMGASAFQEAFMRVGGTVALLNRHKTSRDEQTSATHCGLMVLRNGRMEEVYVRGMDWSNLDFSRPKAAAFSPESRKVFIFQLGGQDYIAETLSLIHI